LQTQLLLTSVSHAELRFLVISGPARITRSLVKFCLSVTQVYCFRVV